MANLCIIFILLFGEKGNVASSKLLIKYGFQLCDETDTEEAYILDKISTT